MSAPDVSAATNPSDASRPAVNRIEAVPQEAEPTQGALLQGAPENDSELEVILGDLDISSSSSGLITVDELERRYIERVLAVTAGNKSRAAQILGFDRRTLYRKIERYGRSS